MHANRTNDLEKTRWHGDGGNIRLRSHNYLYADAHAENLIIPVEEIEEAYISIYTTPNAGWKYW